MVERGRLNFTGQTRISAWLDGWMAVVSLELLCPNRLVAPFCVAAAVLT